MLNCVTASLMFWNVTLSKRVMVPGSETSGVLSKVALQFSPRVLIVNETFVRQYVGQGDPLGQVVRSLAEPGYPESEYEIVGVVGDTRYLSLREALRPIAYAPDSQHLADRPRPIIMTVSPLPVAQTTAAVEAAMASATLKAALEKGLGTPIDH